MRFQDAMGAILALALPLVATQGLTQPPPTFARARSGDEAFLHLQAGLSALDDRARSDSAINSASVPVIQASTNELQDLFAKGSGEAPPSYIESLDMIANALVRAAANNDPAAANKTLSAIRADLEAKLESSRVTLQASQRKPSDVAVTVITMRDTQPVSGYLVSSAPLVLADADVRTPFNQVSNPRTTRTLPPGVYVIYASRNNQQVAQQQATVSLRDPSPITLVVP